MGASGGKSSIIGVLEATQKIKYYPAAGVIGSATAIASCREQPPIRLDQTEVPAKADATDSRAICTV
jgi:hypothetical protein